MSKKYEWKYIEEVTVESEEGQEGEAETKTVEHTVSLVCSMFLGKAIVTIDGDEFDISDILDKINGKS
jgi:UDP-3-O-acyl-N-acetylglucosamine deacetylase